MELAFSARVSEQRSEVLMSDFPEVLTGQIHKLLVRYETKRSAILPILHLIQDHFGWVQDQHVQALETSFALKRVWVEEVLTFYSMYRKEPCKPNRVYFCNNIVCTMLGANQVMDKISQHIKDTKNKTGDCSMSLEGVPCLGVCDGAPAMLVNKDRYLRVTPENVHDILAKYS